MQPAAATTAMARRARCESFMEKISARLDVPGRAAEMRNPSCSIGSMMAGRRTKLQSREAFVRSTVGLGRLCRCSTARLTSSVRGLVGGLARKNTLQLASGSSIRDAYPGRPKEQNDSSSGTIAHPFRMPGG